MSGLSVIVPVYNAEKYLRKCLDSILSSTFKELEVIVIDDGSSDSSPQICDEYEKMDSRIRVIHQKNSGIVHARKVGIEAAAYEYVSFIDSDDWIDSDMYEKMTGIIEKYDVDIVVCNILWETDYGQVKLTSTVRSGYYDKQALDEEFYNRMFFDTKNVVVGVCPSFSNKLIKKRLVENNIVNVNERVSFGEDAMCTYPSMLDANAIYIMDESYFYHYRRVESSITNSYDRYFFLRLEFVCKELKKIIGQKKKSEVLQLQIDYYIVRMFCDGVTNELLLNKKDDLRQRINRCRNVLDFSIISDAIGRVKISAFKGAYKIKAYLITKKLLYIYFVVAKVKRFFMKSW